MLTLNKIKYIGSIQKIFVILLCCVFYGFNSIKANALFTREYQKNLSIGAYKQTYNSDIYLLAEAGYTAYSWSSTLGTAILGYEQYDAVGTVLPNQIGIQLKGKNNYFVRVGLGFHTEKSNFRHELYFKWYSILSKPIGFEGYSIGITDATTGNTTTYNYCNLYGRNIVNGGMYASIYKIMYGLNYDFQNAFKLLKLKWDIYIGVGFGIAIINSGIYANSQINSTSNQLADGTINYTYTYQNNNVKDVDKAEKNSVLHQKSIGIAYSASIGTICNLSQSFAFTMAVNFDATTRPLLTTKFKKISSNQYSKTHLEYNISISMGLLMKAFEIRD